LTWKPPDQFGAGVESPWAGVSSASRVTNASSVLAAMQNAGVPHETHRTNPLRVRLRQVGVAAPAFVVVTATPLPVPVQTVADAQETASRWMVAPGSPAGAVLSGVHVGDAAVGSVER
jgi:hypothetical protein